MNDIQKGLQTVVNKAWNDAQFKSELLANPKSTIQSATGLNVPEGIKIVVNDQTDAGTFYLNIPPKPNFDDIELTDEQLEKVAGGEVFGVATTAWSVNRTINTGNFNPEDFKKMGPTSGQKGW